jgi:hypothetical protein
LIDAKFYLTFPSFDEFVTHCVANLSWTHVRLIMRLDNSSRKRADFRHFYSKNCLMVLLVLKNSDRFYGKTGGNLAGSR